MEFLAMNDTFTNTIEEVTTETTKAPLLSYEKGKFVLTILMCVVTPAISVSGFIGNVFSIKILIRDGLNKCSNILLVNLAFADICFLIGYNNIPKALYLIQGDGSFQYPRRESHILYVVYLVHIFLDYAISLVGLAIPMFITVERLVAVFFPLKFNTIVTPRRVWTLMACLFMYYSAYVTYTLFWYEFAYSYDARFNESVGLIKRSALFYADQPMFVVLEKFMFSFIIAPILTFIGCMVIIVRLRYLANKRKKMTQTSSDKANLKTTQMLLGVCGLYILTCIGLDLPLFLPEEYAAYNLTSENPTILGLITYQVVNIMVCVNSSWNFIIYVAFNQKFRHIFKEIIRGCCKKK